MPLPVNWPSEVARGAVAQFPVGAQDLPQFEGSAMGERLKSLQAHWLQTGLRASKQQLLAH